MCLPDIQAVMKEAMLPAMTALMATLARSVCREGAIAPRAPRFIPIEPKFAKLHTAYVTIVSLRG